MEPPLLAPPPRFVPAVAAPGGSPGASRTAGTELLDLSDASLAPTPAASGSTATLPAPLTGAELHPLADAALALPAHVDGAAAAEPAAEPMPAPAPAAAQDDAQSDLTASMSSGSSRDEQLFVKFFVVALFSTTTRSRLAGRSSADDAKLEPVILDQYPPAQASAATGAVDMLAKAVPAFCFPERDLNNLVVTNDMFVFVMTDSNGDRQYGFCRRRVPRKGNRELYPECLCILSYFPWFSVFASMLTSLTERRETLEQRRELSTDPFKPYLQAVLAHPFPAPGDTFHVRIAGEFVEQLLPMHYYLQRPDETATGLHHVDFSDLFANFDDRAIFTIFASLLHERRVIFYSSSLGRLSGCVHAAVNLVYPFSWQHIFIPILPSTLLDYVHAPMPFVVGIHSTLRPLVERISAGSNEAVVVDIDAHVVATTQDDIKLLPDALLARLRLALRDFLPRSFNALALERKLDQVSNVAISEAFLALLANIFGNYHKYFEPDTLKFQHDKFRSEQPRVVQPFLAAFAGSQMYEQFIVARASRLKIGLDISFKTKVLPESRFERLAASSYSLTSKAMGSLVRSSIGAKNMMGRAMDRVMSQSNPGSSSALPAPEKRLSQRGVSPSSSASNLTKSPSATWSSLLYGRPGGLDTVNEGQQGMSRDASSESLRVDGDLADDPKSTDSSPFGSRRSSMSRPERSASTSSARKPAPETEFGASIRNDLMSMFRTSTPGKTSGTASPQRSPTKPSTRLTQSTSSSSLNSSIKVPAGSSLPGQPVRTSASTQSFEGQPIRMSASTQSFDDPPGPAHATLFAPAPVGPAQALPSFPASDDFGDFATFQPPTPAATAAPFLPPPPSAPSALFSPAPAPAAALVPAMSRPDDGNMIDFGNFEKSKASVLSSFSTPPQHYARPLAAWPQQQVPPHTPFMFPPGATQTPPYGTRPGFVPMPTTSPFRPPPTGTSTTPQATGWTVAGTGAGTGAASPSRPAAPASGKAADPFSSLLQL